MIIETVIINFNVKEEQNYQKESEQLNFLNETIKSIVNAKGKDLAFGIGLEIIDLNR